MKTQSIIYIAAQWNSDNKVSNHHIATELSKNNRVLYIESGAMRKPKASRSDLNKIFVKIAKLFQGIKVINDNLMTYSIVNIPFHNYNIIKKFNKFLTIFLIRRVAIKYGFDNPILWIYTPDFESIIGYLGEKLVVYYCVDDYGSMPNVDSQTIQKMEDSMLKKADLVFVTARALLNDHRKKINQNIFYTPHAVNYEHFSKAQASSDIDKVPNIPGPILGFWGLMEEWFDIDLIEYIAHRHPEWSIVLIGRVAIDTINASKLSNVHFLGVKKFSELPNYAKRFDICLIPFKNYSLTVNINPIKLKEYLSTGKPVVSTYMPEVLMYKDIVEVADTYEDFESKINYVLQKDSETKRLERIKFVEKDSWAARVAEISVIINHHLSEKKVNKS